MSDYTLIAERARRALAAVAKAESLVEREPLNSAARSNLIGLRRIAAVERVEMERLASANHVEICYYRIVPEISGQYGIGRISACLLEYQNLFSQIHDAMKNGPKSRALVGKEAAEESTLDLAYTYSGSLGVALLARSDRDFFTGNLDKPIEVMHQILDIDDVDRVKDLAHALGRAVVKRVHDWSKASVDGGFSADIKWKRSDGRLTGQMIDKKRLEKIVNFIDATADTTTSTIDMPVMLVGGDLQARTFHVTAPDGDSYKGQILEDASLPKELSLGRIYRAEIEVLETYHYATEVSKVVNRLRKLTRLTPG